MLSVTHVSKHYETPRGPAPVLDDVSLSVDRGEAVAVMGPSGCGKSTLLYIIGALEPPSGGSIAIDGQDPYALAEREQAAERGMPVDEELAVLVAHGLLHLAGYEDDTDEGRARMEEATAQLVAESGMEGA